MLELLRRNLIENTLDADFAWCLSTGAAAESLSKRLLTSSSVMAPMATFVRCKMDVAIVSLKYSVAFASNELMDTVEPYKDGSESLQSCRDSRSDDPPGRKSSKQHSKRRHDKSKTKD